MTAVGWVQSGNAGDIPILYKHIGIKCVCINFFLMYIGLLSKGGTNDKGKAELYYLVHLGSTGLALLLPSYLP